MEQVAEDEVRWWFLVRGRRIAGRPKGVREIRIGVERERSPGPITAGPTQGASPGSGRQSEECLPRPERN